MGPNYDFLTEEECEKLKQISKDKNIYLYELGRLCGVKDKGFWSRIMNNKKPVPEHVRHRINQIITEV